MMTIILNTFTGTPKKMVCYYGTWAVYRPGNGKFDVEDIDPFLCTHIIYGFTGLGTDNKIKCLDPWNDLYDGGGKGALYRFTGLKRKNTALKALVAIGGWNEGSEGYSKVSLKFTCISMLKNTKNVSLEDGLKSRIKSHICPIRGRFHSNLWFRRSRF